jgi:hypothetical protein
MDTELEQMSEDLKEIIRHINESNKLVDRTDPVRYHSFHESDSLLNPTFVTPSHNKYNFTIICIITGSFCFRCHRSFEF